MSLLLFNCKLAKHMGAVLFGLMLLTSFNQACAGSIPAELIQKNVRVQEADLVLSAQSLIKRVRNGEKITLIDVRQPSEFEPLHIPGAMNIPLHFIKNKSYLKNAPMVLVDQGLSLHRLSPVCRHLRSKGFSVWILDGGMNAWGSYNGPMQGEPVRQMAYYGISSADFFQEKDYAKRIVCDVSATRSPAAQQLMPYAVHLPLTDNPKNWAAQLEKFKTTHARNGAVAILVVNENGQGYPNIRSAFDRAGFKGVFYLNGGLSAYKGYLEDLSLSWQPRQKRMVTLNQCNRCAESEAQTGN